MDKRAIVGIWNYTNNDRQMTAVIIADDDGKPLGGDFPWRDRETEERRGVSITQFLAVCGVDLADFMKKFPGALVPFNKNQRLGWEMSFMIQDFPHERDSMRRLAEYLRIPIEVYIHVDRNNGNPQFRYRVDPSPESIAA